ncbi:MAG TPA: SAM-dependent methyltransferase [Desulfobacterales bacterium]|nr:SAM-dependent methyltransferase [Desulfobacterales bacterium]
MDTPELNPGQLLEISGDYWKACALHAGVKLDIFTAIGEKRRTDVEIAQKLNLDKRAVTTFLNALTAMNLLKKTGDIYSNTRSSKSFLSKDSQDYIGYFILHHHHLVVSWSQLDRAVKTGKPIRTGASQKDKGQRESFIMGMFNLARGLAPRLSNQINLSNRQHLIDLGGGPGTYAVYFCLKNPRLKATVYDLPSTQPFAEKIIEKFGLSDRIDFIEGNYLEDSIQGTYDVALLSNILHTDGHENCQMIINKTVAALEPGGLVVVHDFILDNTMDGPLFPALFSLNMLLGTDAGQSYSEEQIMGMLESAGLKKIERHPFQGPSASGIITGIVE